MNQNKYRISTMFVLWSDWCAKSMSHRRWDSSSECEGNFVLEDAMKARSAILPPFDDVTIECCDFIVLCSQV
jgi:hypothetical protein